MITLWKLFSSTNPGINQNVRPVSGLNRPVSGFARPATQSRNQSSAGNRDISTAFKGYRPGTSRPMSMAGRFVRLGTASMLSDDNGWIPSKKVFSAKDAKKPAIAKATCDFLLYSDHNPVRALALAAVCTKEVGFTDWWWKSRLGKCYYQLGRYPPRSGSISLSLSLYIYTNYYKGCIFYGLISLVFIIDGSP